MTNANRGTAVHSFVRLITNAYYKAYRVSRDTSVEIKVGRRGSARASFDHVRGHQTANFCSI